MTRTIQPAPYGSAFTSSGSPARAAFASTTGPDTGANRSLTALTDSTTPNAALWVKRPADLGQLDEDDVPELARPRTP